MSLFPTERKCSVCKKAFLGWEEWRYRRDDKWFCSWGCLRKHDKKARANRANARRLDRMERSEVVELLRKGTSPQRIADQVGVSVQAIMYYKQKAGA